MSDDYTGDYERLLRMWLIARFQLHSYVEFATTSDPGMRMQEEIARYTAEGAARDLGRYLTSLNIADGSLPMLVGPFEITIKVRRA